MALLTSVPDRLATARHFLASIMLLPFLVCVGLMWPAATFAQGPALDPSFAIGQVYTPGSVSQAVQQADGKRILLGDFEQVSGVTIVHSGYNALARLLVGNGQLDTSFAANISGLQCPTASCCCWADQHRCNWAA